MSDSFIQFANSFQSIARLGLESIENLLSQLGNPQNDLSFIHIAGTNGKGSVCAFLQNIFTHAGYRTGKYTSPNLISVCERISIDGENISEDDLHEVMSIVENGAKKTIAELGDSPTQFELWTAAAFCYFKKQACDIVILETGLGGTQDATNIIPPPLASVITRIDLDHTEYLGNTLADVASQKAGIIKKPLSDHKTGLTISAPQYPEAEKVLQAVCNEQNNRLIISDTPNSQGTNGCHELFSYKGIENMCCGIAGYHQLENAAIAIETALALGISSEHIKYGIEAASNPARFEILQENPLVIYDGAHNRNGMHSLAASLKRYFPSWTGATFITAFMGDKDIDGVFEELETSGLSKNSQLYAVKVKDNPRAAEATTVCDIAKKHGFSSISFGSIKAAYENAISQNKLVVICGSLYLYKDLKEEISHI